MLKGLFGGTWTGWRGASDDGSAVTSNGSNATSNATSDTNDNVVTESSRKLLNSTTHLCYTSPKATPIPLHANYSCLPHFYCPNTTESNLLSLPSMCPPSIECQMKRLVSDFCPEQGLYEPLVCPRGFYW